MLWVGVELAPNILKVLFTALVFSAVLPQLPALQALEMRGPFLVINMTVCVRGAAGF